jgi:hypothetical protein
MDSQPGGLFHARQKDFRTIYAVLLIAFHSGGFDNAVVSATYQTSNAGRRCPAATGQAHV